MICPNCHDTLPEGLYICFHCGASLDKLDAVTESLCKGCNNPLPEGLESCFNCGMLQGEADIPDPVPQPTDAMGVNTPIMREAVKTVTVTDGGKTGHKAILAAVLALIVIVGGLAGVHFTGLVTLPFLPERSAASEDGTTLIAETPGVPENSGGEWREISFDGSGINDERLAEMIASGEIPADVTELRLNNNQISDLTPLSGLSDLRFLWLHENQVSDLSPLSGLDNLEGLFIDRNHINSVEALRRLTRLAHLHMNNNQTSDLSPLSGLTNLEQLALTNNDVSDISPLGGLTELTHLYLEVSRISDISPLSELKNLEVLYLSAGQINDVTPLYGLNNLTDLRLMGNPLSPEQIENLRSELPATQIDIFDSGAGDDFSAPDEREEISVEVSEEYLERTEHSVSFNMELVGLLGRTNGDLRAVFGNEAYCEIWRGGTPVVSYDTPDTAKSFINFWLDSDYDEMIEVWENSPGVSSTENVWPDHFTVGAIEIWEDSIPRMYNSTEYYITPDMMNESFGQSPEMHFVSVYDHVMDGYAFDVWNSEYILDDYILNVTFRENGREGSKYVFYSLLSRR